MTGGAVALAVMAGGLLCLERKTWAQLMLSRPIVVAPIVAALLGDVRAGFALGIPMELAFLGTAAFGVSTPLHETLAALFAASLAAACGRGGGAAGPQGVLALAFFCGLPFAVVGRGIEARIERHNVALVDQAEEILAHGRTGRATRHALLSVVGTVLMGVAVTLLGVLAGLAFSVWPASLPPWLERTLTCAWPLATGTSAALAIRAIKTPRGPLLSAVAALAVFVIGFAVIWLNR